MTRFVMADGSPSKDYGYATPAEAYAHMLAFRKDNSGLYRAVAVVDGETGTTWSAATADALRKMTKRIDVGQRVRAAGGANGPAYVVEKIFEATAEADVRPAAAPGAARRVGLDEIEPA